MIAILIGVRCFDLHSLFLGSCILFFFGLLHWFCFFFFFLLHCFDGAHSPGVFSGLQRAVSKGLVTILWGHRAPWTGAFCSWCVAVPSSCRFLSSSFILLEDFEFRKAGWWWDPCICHASRWQNCDLDPDLLVQIRCPSSEHGSSLLLPWPEPVLPGLSWPHSQPCLSSSSSLASPIVDICL